MEGSFKVIEEKNNIKFETRNGIEIPEEHSAFFY